MQRWLIGLVVAVVTGFPAAAERVDIPTPLGRIAGTLTVPDNGRRPAVLLLHGFGGSREEQPIAGTSETLFGRTARVLAEHGFASLRIDFRGGGDSDGNWADTTLTGQTADALAALDWLRGHGGIDPDRVSILGFSQGGLIAMLAAAQRPQVRALVLWAPVVHPLWTYQPLIGRDALIGALDADPHILIPPGSDEALKAAFFQELVRVSPPALVGRYAGPLKVIMARHDSVIVPPQAAGEVLLDHHHGPESLAMVEADHAWNVHDGPETVDAELLPLTLQWLLAHN